MGTENRMDSSFPNSYSFSYPYLKTSFSIVNYKTELFGKPKSSICHLCDYIAGEHMHTDIIIYYIEEPQ